MKPGEISAAQLFPMEALRPTTREVAALVKEGGVAALVDARLRADAARYQEAAAGRR